MNQEELFLIAENFRNAIIEAVRQGEFSKPFMPHFVNSFPTGCCTFASELLAIHLFSLGLKCIDFSGRCGVESHAWLRIKSTNIIVDITGDQYKYNGHMYCYDVPVYVGSPDRFHQLFETSEQEMTWLEDSYSSDPNDMNSKNRSCYEIIMRYYGAICSLQPGEF